MSEPEQVNHPAHYGGADNPCEHQKVVRAWGLGYFLGCATKYIARAGKKPGVDALTDLRKARWFLDAEIQHLEAQPGQHIPGPAK